MANGEQKADVQDLGVLPDNTRAWWTSVLTGEAQASHPIHGTKLKARLDGDTLVLSGNVATTAEP